MLDIASHVFYGESDTNQIIFFLDADNHPHRLCLVAYYLPKNFEPTIYPGAHIDNEEKEGKGGSAKRPRGRLKFQIFPTVVVLLSLDIDDVYERICARTCTWLAR